MIHRPINDSEYEKRSLSTVIFERIRDEIVDGQYQSGDSLVETKLAEEFGVSRTPIREAIRQLELDGLIRFVPNKGAIVQGITERDVDEIYAIRRSIEGLAARWASERATTEDLIRMDETVALMEFYTVRDDVDQVTRLDMAFHDLIIESSKSRPVKHALGSLNHYIQRARVASLRVPGRIKVSLEEHKAIFKAIKDRKPDLAEELLTGHVDKATTNLLSRLSDGDDRGTSSP